MILFPKSTTVMFWEKHYCCTPEWINLELIPSFLLVEM